MSHGFYFKAPQNRKLWRNPPVPLEKIVIRSYPYPAVEILPRMSVWDEVRPLSEAFLI